MKLHRNVIESVVTALEDIFVHGRHADKTIERAFKFHKQWGARDRKIVAESVYDIVRWWRWVWHLAGLPDAECLQTEAMTRAKLWRVWGAYWVKQTGEVALFAECSAVRPEDVGAREVEKVPDAVRAAVPDWLWDLCSRELGAHWPRTIQALNQQAPVDLRVNTTKVSRSDLSHLLHTEKVEAAPVSGVPDALRLRERKNLFITQSFRDGLFELQDANSQRIAPFLDVKPGMRVIDACAGAGGKTLHLAVLMQNKGRLVALDVHKWKLEELRRRARRNGAGNIEAKLIEGAKTIKRLARGADRVLLDVPCTGLGVLRRNPDTKWKLTPAELERLVEVQREILQSHSRMVKPGGKLVYATCSILPSENERQVRAFIDGSDGEWTLEEEMRTYPGQAGGDGFYAARMVRRADGNPAPEDEGEG